MTPPILCYHKVDTRLELGFTRVGPRVFRRQVESLARAGYAALGSDDLERWFAGAYERADLPPRAFEKEVVFSFDDGYDSLATHAFPVLAEHGFRAIVFVITDFVGRENSWDVQYGWRRFHHLSWDQLGYWQERGIEVHSHGTNHARMTWLPDDQVAEELGRSRETITARLGRAPAAISYPFGAADARIRRLAVESGYTLGFAGPASASSADDPMLIERRPVYWWDAFAPPLVMRPGASGAFAHGVARLTNSFAVGTAAIQKALGRRYQNS